MSVRRGLVGANTIARQFMIDAARKAKARSRR